MAQSKVNGSHLRKRRDGASELALRAYLDTNVLVEHYWWKYFGKEKPRKSKAVLLVEKGFRGDYDCHISYVNIMELSSHLRDWFLLQKVVKGGFSYHNFKREKHRYTLSPEQKKLVGKIMSDYTNSPFVNYIEVDEVSHLFFVRIRSFVDNYIELMDAFHIVLAQAVECDYIVTKDRELRARFQRIISEKIVELPSSLKPISPTAFLKLLK